MTKGGFFMVGFDRAKTIISHNTQARVKISAFSDKTHINGIVSTSLKSNDL